MLLSSGVVCLMYCCSLCDAGRCVYVVCVYALLWLCLVLECYGWCLSCVVVCVRRGSLFVVGCCSWMVVCCLCMLLVIVVVCYVLFGGC